MFKNVMAIYPVVAKIFQSEPKKSIKVFCILVFLFHAVQKRKILLPFSILYLPIDEKKRMTFVTAATHFRVNINLT